MLTVLIYQNQNTKEAQHKTPEKRKKIPKEHGQTHRKNANEASPYVAKKNRRQSLATVFLKKNPKIFIG